MTISIIKQSIISLNKEAKKLKTQKITIKKDHKN